MWKFVSLAILGVVALFAAMPTPAEACRYGRYNYWGNTIYVGSANYGVRDYWYASPGYYGYYRGWRRAAFYPTYAVGYYYPTTVMTSSSMSFYPPVQDANSASATIRMHVPSGARVWFDGSVTTQNGTDRTFVSPNLTPGHEYAYQIRVQWDENGRAVERTRDVMVRAGQQVQVNIEQ